jgi:hypothetical protein
MATVSVLNCKDISFRRKIKSLANFVINKFMSSHVADQIYVQVVIKKHIDDSDSPVGTCVWEDERICGREFTIELATRDLNDNDRHLTQDNILQNLAHELVHLKQWAKGEKVFHERTDNVRYKGKLYRSDKMNYWEYPWEIEAYGWELSLMTLWKESLEKSK